MLSLSKNIVLVYHLVPSIQSAIVFSKDTTDAAWYHYKVQFNKEYDAATELSRQQAFLESLRYVIVKNIEHDLTGHWYQAGINCASDIPAYKKQCLLTDDADEDYADDDIVKDNAQEVIHRKDTPNVSQTNYVRRVHHDAKVTRYANRVGIFKDIREVKETEEFEQTYSIDENRNLTGIMTNPPFQDSVTVGCCSVPKQPCPEEINWKDEHVYKAGCQGDCGDCYAWAATYAISSALSIKKNKTPIDLSVQEAKDCSYYVSKYGNKGCDGGNPSLVYAGLEKNTGFTMTEASHYTSYNDKTGPLTCDATTATKVKSVTITGKYYKRRPNDCRLEQELEKGPVTARMCSYSNVDNWKANSKTDIYKNTNCAEECKRENNMTRDAKANHVVLLIGYTPTTWIIQNSRGPDWGFNGTAHFARGKPGHPRMCNLAETITWPVVQ